MARPTRRVKHLLLPHRPWLYLPSGLRTQDGRIAAVPLLVKAPGQSSARTDPAYATRLDVTPTIADLLQLQLGYEPDGRSLLSEAVRSRTSAPMPDSTPSPPPITCAAGSWRCGGACGCSAGAAGASTTASAPTATSWGGHCGGCA